jgi:hypothetical protein
MDDLLPRADISGALAPLVAGLGSSNWKDRKAALDEVEAAVAAAGGRIQPNVRRAAGGGGRLGLADGACESQACSLG